MSHITPTNLIGFLLPQNSQTLRGSLNWIADKSETGFLHSCAARIVALGIPLFALSHVPVYVLRGLTGSASLALEGEFRKAVVKIKEEMTHALQALALAVASVFWALLGLFAGARLLTCWRTPLPPPPVDPTVELNRQLEEARAEIEQATAAQRAILATNATLTQENGELYTQLETARGDRNRAITDNQALTRRNEELLAELRTARQNHADLLEQHQLLSARSQEERATLQKQLQQSAEKIRYLEQVNKELVAAKTRLERERIEKELLDSLDCVLITDGLSETGGAAPINGHQETFDHLKDQLLQETPPGSGPIYQIQSKPGFVLAVSRKKVETIDDFTASVLNFMLIKGYERVKNNRLSRDEFVKLLEEAGNIFSQFAPQTELEYLSLKQTLELFKSLNFENGAIPVIDVSPERSVRTIVNAILTGTTAEVGIHHPCVKEAVALPLLKEMFGKAIVDEVACYYFLSSEKPWYERDLAMLIVGIAANMDLKSAKTYLKTENEEQLIEGLMALRTSALAFVGSTKLLPNGSQDQQLKKDIDSLKALVKVGTGTKTANQFKNPERLACIEHLARDLAYSLFDPSFSYHYVNGGGVTRFKEEMLVTLWLNGQPRLYQTHQLIREGGIYGVTLLPVYPAEDDEGVVLFRGTFDVASACRDVAFWEKLRAAWGEGPGAWSYNGRERTIVENFKRATQEKGIKNWIGVGHSLGGSDISRFTATIFAPANRVSVDEVASMKIYTFNAPHVELETREKLNAGLRGRHFFATYFEGEGDVVHLVGTKLATEAQSLTVRFKQEGAQGISLAPHSSPWFTRDGDPTLSDNNAQMDRIVNEMLVPLQENS